MPRRTPARILGRLILSALALAGCGSEPERPIGSGPGDSTGVALVFADPALQAAVEQAAAGTGDAAGLVSLAAKERGITDLGGIEELTRLEVLDLYGNEIRDLSPLAELTRLRYLDLGSNRVEEVSALESLKDLQVLLLADNAVKDVSALAGLDSLQSVDLTGNPLSASAEAQVAALRERGVEVEFGAPEEPGPGAGGIVLGDLPIVFASSRRTGEWLEVHSLDPKTGAVVNLSEGLATAPFSDGSEPDTLDWRFLPGGQIVLVRWGQEPAQSPDGTRIAFTSSRDGDREIYVMDADGGAPQNLTFHEAWDLEPAWSPDGGRIAFVSDRNGEVEEFGGLRFNTDIFVMNADGSGVAQVTSDPLSRSAGDPAWSPDGSSIVFQKAGGGIFVLELSSGEARNLTDDGWAPSWSPDGRWIAFIRTVEREESHVWKIPAGGGEATQLTLDRFFRTSPTWSPDSDHIVFAREDREGGGGSDLYVIPAEGGAGEPITDDPGADTDPHWAPF